MNEIEYIKKGGKGTAHNPKKEDFKILLIKISFLILKCLWWFLVANAMLFSFIAQVIIFTPLYMFGLTKKRTIKRHCKKWRF